MGDRARLPGPGVRGRWPGSAGRARRRLIVARLDALVAEIDGLLRVVLDVGDVAGRVVGVVQVLHLFSGPAGDGGLRVVAGESLPRCAEYCSWVSRKVSGS